MERYWQNTWQYKRILEILDDYWITEKDETFVQIVMHFKKGDKEQHKTIVWFNPKLIPDIDADPDIPSLDEIPARHGKWDKGTDFDWHICEECGAEVDISMGTGVWVEGIELHELNFCPNCGADMRGADNDSI